MKRRLFGLVGLLALPPLALARAQESAPAGWQESLRVNAAAAHGLRCGTPVPSAFPGQELLRVPNDCSASSTTIQPQYQPLGGVMLQIPVVFHVIEDSMGIGSLTDAQVASQIEILNEDFLALGGTNGAGGTNTRIQFYLATVDPNGDPTDGITNTVNTTWFNDSGSYWDTLAWDPNAYLNIYSNTASGFLGYTATIPQFGGAGDPEDRVVLRWETVGRDAPIGPPFDAGRTGTHELGHYLGLYHTFQSGCQPVATCYENGDLICDTNPQDSPTSGCPVSPMSCGNVDPSDNYMDYTDDVCMGRFTPEQANRMRCTVDEWRPGLQRAFCGPGLASAVVRNAGSNPNVLTAEPPRMGEPQRYDVTTTPYLFAIIVAWRDPGNLVLKDGQVLLLNTASPKIFQLPILTGPDASITIMVPLDLAFCGAAVSVQAILFGGTTPFALTNAIDMQTGS